MQIKEATIFNFGKLQNRTFQFAPGINIIYGENEAGKSTLQAFLMGMLFGMEKGRGRTSENDMYSRYEPWHAPAYYSGALRFSVGDQPFYLERNFYSKEKRELLRNEADGEELSVAYGDLTMLLGGIDKETFGNTYYIPQSGAATSAAMTELLSDYYSDVASGWEGHVPVIKAVEALKNRKRELLAEIKKEKETRENAIQQHLIEQELLRRDCEQLRESQREFEKEQERITAQISRDFCPKGTGEISRNENAGHTGTIEDTKSAESARIAKNARAMGSAVAAGFVGAACILVLSHFVFLQPWQISGLAAAVPLLLVLLYCMFIRKNKTLEAEAYITEEKNIETADKVTDEMLQHAENMLAQLNDSLQEKENRLVNLGLELEQLRTPSTNEQVRTEDVEALELAMMELERLSSEYYEDMEDELNAEISRWVSLLTAGAYDSIRMEKDGRLFVLTEGKEVQPQALSKGTLEQIYLALRMAVGSIVTREEELPVFLDETFAMYDDRRLGETLKVMKQSQRQIFIFTCQNRESRMLDELGIVYQKVML